MLKMADALPTAIDLKGGPVECIRIPRAHLVVIGRPGVDAIFDMLRLAQERAAGAVEWYVDPCTKELCIKPTTG
jgi:hypothetical protein